MARTFDPQAERTVLRLPPHTKAQIAQQLIIRHCGLTELIVLAVARLDDETALQEIAADVAAIKAKLGE